ncbi:hypothetical protein MATL_G00131570 [Megalops atlanticus]|uniref:Uncharacterized protein n=1 Tax=Megalops atlanticus TaxID=7932 RepID=A0A9D3PVQ5_MEGAT|nr:hypothetical protein MATL_G00131570 [Megalops atlanticus]
MLGSTTSRDTVLRAAATKTMLKPSLWATAAVMTLFITFVTSNPAHSEEEWKSLSNPQSRMLFFRILQSYFDGQGLNLMSPGKENQVPEGLDSRFLGSYLDEHRHQLQSNSIYDV